MEYTMNQEILKKRIDILKEDINLQKIIQKTLLSFGALKNATNDELFEELCYCILTANCKAQTCMNIQITFPHSFSNASKKQIYAHLKNHQYRFPNIRAQYIIEAQSYSDQLQQILNNNKEVQRRDWLIKNIKGLGIKEASHFLRNVGYENYAIIDTHIISLLQRYHIVQKPKTLSKKKYLSIEKQLKGLAEETNLTCASLDLYLWYEQTGMILK